MTTPVQPYQGGDTGAGQPAQVQPAQPQPAQPQPAQPAQHQAPPVGGGSTTFFDKKRVLMMVLLGIVLFFVGMMVVTSAVLLDPPDRDDYDYDEMDDYQDDYEDYDDAKRNALGGGRIILEIGGLLACVGLFGGAIANEELDVKIRVVFVSAAIAFIISVLVVLNVLGPWAS